MLYEAVEKMVGKEDAFEIFGNSGSGKTTFAVELAKEYLAKGKKVLYIDTEKNIRVKPPEKMEYAYAPSFDEMYSILVKNTDKGKLVNLDAVKDNIDKALGLTKKYDLVVLDSMGLPILGKFALMDMRQKGVILLACEAISALLKHYSHKHSSLVLVTNQPQSEMRKSSNPYAVLWPFGEKSAFFYKEIWKTRLVTSRYADGFTKCYIELFRGSLGPRGTPLFELKISNNGIKIDNLYEKEQNKTV